jgi:hypothetical protein
MATKSKAQSGSRILLVERVDLSGIEFACCASSFSEFLYRFWIENEIWYSLIDDDSQRPLKTFEQAYVNHYASRQR